MKTPLNVLIVEDSEFDARMMVSVLRQGGYEPAFERVETAEQMRAALASKPCDVVLSDHNLPSFSAPEALKILKDTGLDLPFIIVSGGIGEDVAVAAMKSGAHDYLMKGNLARLTPAVERELREAANRAARRQAEAEVRENELRYRLLWENCADAVLLMDTDSNIHFANPAVEKFFGYTPGEVVGQNLTLLLPDRPNETRREGLARTLRSGVFDARRHVMETLGLRKDGQAILIEIAVSDMELHNKRWFIAFVRDITERKRSEQALRENQEQFRVAREIQQRLFPKAAPVVPGFDIAGATFPAEATGGDYFDFLHMLNGRLGIIVADVTGHGVGPALLMSETRAYLRILARNREDVGEILTRANRILAEDVDYEHYVTLFLGRLDPRRRSLVYASAGHPAGFVLGPTGQIKATLRRTGVPLGINPDTAYVASAEIELEPGDLVLLVTDGVEEAMSPDNIFFGQERTLAVVRQHSDKPAREIVQRLYQAVREFSGDTPQADDLTAVIIKVG